MTNESEFKTAKPQRRGQEPRSVEDRFWEKVDMSGGPDACWPFTGCISKVSGYGVFSKLVDGKWVTCRANRVAWEFTHGEIPAGKLVLHKDVCGGLRKCCNPGHLYLGNNRQNAIDAVRNGTVPQFKLKPHHATSIVHLFEADAIPIPKLSEMFPVSGQQIENILAGRSWSKVTGIGRTRPRPVPITKRAEMHA